MRTEELLERAAHVPDFPARPGAILAFLPQTGIFEQAWLSVLQIEFLLQPGCVITVFHSNRGLLHPIEHRRRHNPDSDSVKLP